MTDTFEEEVVDGLDNDLGVGIEDDSDGTGVAQALLGLVGTALKEATVDVAGDEVVDCGLAGFCGRLALYHCSASGSVLNFLNLAPGNPWTYDWASSLEMDTIQRLSKKKPHSTGIAGTDPKRSLLKIQTRHGTSRKTYQVVNTPTLLPLQTA